VSLSKRYFWQHERHPKIGTTNFGCISHHSARVRKQKTLKILCFVLYVEDYHKLTQTQFLIQSPLDNLASVLTSFPQKSHFTFRYSHSPGESVGISSCIANGHSLSKHVHRQQNVPISHKKWLHYKLDCLSFIPEEEWGPSGNATRESVRLIIIHPISTFDAGWQPEILSPIARLPAGLVL
jgi:hypothetical protein